MLTIPLVLLHISTIFTFALFIIMLRIKNKAQLHIYALGLVLVIFLWCLSSLAEQYAIIVYEYQGMLFTNISFSIVTFLPVCLFLFGLVYAFPDSPVRSRFNLLFIIPVFSILLIWTNDYHHLFFIEYSVINSEIVKGPYLIVFPFFAYLMDFLGLIFIIVFSIKNSGFFSKQSLLIVIGTLFPLAVDIAFVLNIFSFPLYYEPISFSIAIIFFMISIFRFGLLRVIPIALQTVVDHMSDSYLVVNQHHAIIDFNKTLVDSFRSVMLITRKLDLKDFLMALDGISSVKYDDFMKSFHEAADTRKSVVFEVKYASKSLEKTYMVEITPIFVRNALNGTLILLKDITDQKKSFETIQQTQRMLIESEHLASLGQLMGGIAHNLKTPIMSISGGLLGLSDLIDEYDESVEDDAVTPEDHREIAEDMRVWVGKMREYTAYMSDIISTVKGQAVQLTATTMDSFSLRELIKRVDILMNHELKKFGCRLDIQCDSDMDLEVAGEINSLVQVINNLITNGIEAYEGRAGVIRFIITTIDGMIQFEIRDFGSGMSDAVQSKLFKEMITTKAKKGTGLGLYMSYSTITGRFGGKMWFESVYGMGTSFYITIPAHTMGDKE